MKEKNWYFGCLILLLATLFKPAPLSAGEKAGANDIRGFYYDHEREKYFSNDSNIFSIRPVRDRNYLDRIEVSVNGEEFTPYGGKLTFKEEGLHTVRFRAIDPVLNWSPIQTFRIYVDKTAPKGQVVWQGPNFLKNNVLYINPKSVLTVIGQDNLSGILGIYWDHAGKTSLFPGNISFSENKKHSFNFFVVDNVGNRSETFNLSFQVDGKPPRTSLNIAGTNYRGKKGIYVNADARLEIRANDSLSGTQRIEYRPKDKGPVAVYRSPISLSGNETVFKYRAVDNVGNEAPWKEVTVFQDTKAPKIRISKVGKHFMISGKIFARPGFQFEVKTWDEGSGLKRKLVSLDGKTFTESTEQTYSFDKPGEYQFHLKAEDKVGNVEDANPYVIVIDNTAPEVKMKYSEMMVERDGVLLSSTPNRIFFEIKDSGVGADRVEVSYDGKKFRAQGPPIELSEWKKSKRTLYYKAYDRLGNSSNVQKVVINIRTKGPGVDLFVESDKFPEVPLSAIRKKTPQKGKSGRKGKE